MLTATSRLCYDFSNLGVLIYNCFDRMGGEVRPFLKLTRITISEKRKRKRKRMTKVCAYILSEMNTHVPAVENTTAS